MALTALSFCRDVIDLFIDCDDAIMASRAIVIHTRQVIKISARKVGKGGQAGGVTIRAILILIQGCIPDSGHMVHAFTRTDISIVA